MLCSKCRTRHGHDRAKDSARLLRPVGRTPHHRPRPRGRRGTLLRFAGGLSYAVVALLSLVIAADLFSVIAAVGLQSLIGTAYSETDLEQATSLMDTAGVLRGSRSSPRPFVFIVWFQRARINAGVFAPDLQRRGRGWAIGGWFIPIGNLYIPRAIAADIWAASRRTRTERGSRSRTPSSTSGGPRGSPRI